MKQQVIAVFFLAALTLTLLAGCQSANADPSVNANTPLIPLGNPSSPKASAAPMPTPPAAEPAAPTPAAEPAAPTPAAEPAAPAAPQLLTAEEAEAIALADAQLTAEAVIFDRTELDLERSGKVYEVEFRSGDYEYDYEIQAETGEILRRDREYDPQKPPVTEKPVTPPAEPEPTEPVPQLLTAKEAEAIALVHAGLTAEEVIFEPTETDREKGKTVYEVEFRAGNWEYSYEIDAETGKILEWEKEFDD